MNRWAAYSRFVLMVIPEDTDVRLHVGVAASQFCVENAERERLIQSGGISSYQREIAERIESARGYLEKIRPSLATAEIDAMLLRFCDFFPGGATQIFVEYVKDFYLFDLDALHNGDGASFTPNFSTEKMNGDWIVPKDRDASHFLYDDKKAQIRVHEGIRRLFKDGQFDREAAEIEQILERFKFA